MPHLLIKTHLKNSLNSKSYLKKKKSRFQKFEIQRIYFSNSKIQRIYFQKSDFSTDLFQRNYFSKISKKISKWDFFLGGAPKKNLNSDKMSKTKLLRWKCVWIEGDDAILTHLPTRRKTRATQHSRNFKTENYLTILK